MIREVLRYPDPRLKRPATRVEEVTDAVLGVIEDLWDTVASVPRTVGLAAPQLGEPRRICVVDCTGHRKVPSPQGPLVLIDPVVLRAEGSAVGREGCLSLPDITANVRRATSVAVSALDGDGARRTVAAEGFEARVILHEIDHLDGILILDRVASLALDVFPRRQ